MGKTFDAQVQRLLKDAGCHFVRAGQGSHEIWFSPITGRNIAFPHGILSRHTANAVLKQAGLPKI